MNTLRFSELIELDDRPMAIELDRGAQTPDMPQLSEKNYEWPGMPEHVHDLIDEYHADEPKEQPEEEAGRQYGLLTPDGREILTSKEAKKLVWQTFGLSAEEIETRYGTFYEMALLSKGMILVRGAAIAVGMLGQNLTNEQKKAVSQYLFDSFDANSGVVIEANWINKDSLQVEQQEILYKGAAVGFWSSGSPRASLLPRLQFTADLTDELISGNAEKRRKQLLRRQKVKEQREEITVAEYDAYNMPVIRFEGGEYALATDSMADTAAFKAAQEAFDSGFMNKEFVEQYVDGEDFAKDFYEDSEYWNDYVRQNWEDHFDASDFPEGQEEPTDEQLEEWATELEEARRKEIANDPVEYLREVGYDAEDVAKKLLPYVNETELCKAAVNEDGRGNFLSHYDGEENELQNVGIEILALPDEVLEALGINRRYRDIIYVYRQN